MVHLASLPPGARAGIAELAKAAEVSTAFLTKVLKRLADAGLIVSYRGPSGGFSLAAPAGDVSLLDVIEAVEGPIRLNLCTGVRSTSGAACHRQSWCAVSPVWMHAQARLRQVLVEASLESLARDSARRLGSRLT